MHLFLWLAGVARCASAALCPSDADLIEAMKAENAAKTTATAQRPTADGMILIVHFADPQTVSDVVCGEALPEDAPAVTCKFTARYPRSDAYRGPSWSWMAGVGGSPKPCRVTRDRPRE